jgi:hypothetical protein
MLVAMFKVERCYQWRHFRFVGTTEAPSNTNGLVRGVYLKGAR